MMLHGEAPVKSSTTADEIARGERFAFGENWTRFLRVLSPERVAEAERSLCLMLETENLSGRTFLDIGSGSGLFSLAARRLGAQVLSFDYDPQSVACTAELRRRFFQDDPLWRIEPGSILDPAYVSGLGCFDIVYSWGVLHHTGKMWQALENAGRPVAVGGRLFIAIYNYQTYWTRYHSAVKRTYARCPRVLQPAVVVAYATMQAAKGLIKDLLTLQDPRARYRNKLRSRGMSMWYDWVDWLGGYPFETAKPDQVFDFFRTRGFVLERLVTVAGGHGCNEFIFRRVTPASGGSAA
jgi:2-polyprenyl-6-hydroxyphenyl methylase/3-demethylubiquinone-9 3-methyltransferase